MPHLPPTFKWVPDPPPGRRQDNRPSPAKRGYDRTWRKLRKAFLREHPLCAKCGQPASEVHHVHDLARGGPRLDPAGLVALCKSCHSRHTARSRGWGKRD